MTRAAPPTWSTALVTGASSGIGRAFAVQLAAAGTDLVLVARGEERLQELAADLRSSAGVAVEVLARDLSDRRQLEAVGARLDDRARPVELLVNSAGFGSTGPFAQLPLDEEETQIRLNVIAPVVLSRAALPGMLERRAGGILNVSSLAALQPIPRWATYAATKAYLTSFSEALHEEVRSQGVSVLALMPGFTRTGFQDRSNFPPSALPGPAWMDADDVARAGLRALERGRAECVPGLGYRLLAGLSRLTPWAVTRRVLNVAGRRL